jgi:hypothetical protein
MALEELNSTMDETLLRKWTKQAARAQKRREEDETEMDVYDAATSKGKRPVYIPITGALTRCA